MIELPDEHSRLVIIGRTGGGKTLCGLWHLSLQPLLEFPWVILDWKRDENIARIPYTHEITVDSAVPDAPGIYILRPLSGQEDEVDGFLRRMWEHENIGLFVDEGSMLRGSRPFQDIQTQGRSKNIPVITLTQLPVYLPRSVFTEASYIQVFYVLDERYRKVIAGFTPISPADIDRLKRYWSWYYNVVENQLTLVKPGPTFDRILPRFEVLKPEQDQFNGEETIEEKASEFSRGIL